MGRVVASDLKSALRAKWKHTVRKLPLAARFAWLKGEEGIAAFGARQRWDKLAHIRGEIIALYRQVPSMTWAIDAERRGAAFPIPGMVLSRGMIRIGDQTMPTRRYIPAIIASIEDMLDCMDVLRANHYHHPPSITGLQMEMIGWRKGMQEREKLKTRSGKPRKTGESRHKAKFFSSAAVVIGYEPHHVTVVAQRRGSSVKG
mgnify:CR=1 FL=1